MTNVTKVCAMCKQEKPKSEFHKRADKACGVQSKCKDCTSEYKKKRYYANRDHELSVMTRSRLKPENIEQRKGYYEKNKEQYRERHFRYMADPEKKLKNINNSKALYLTKKEVRKEFAKISYQQNKEKIRVRHKANYEKRKASGRLAEIHQEKKASDPIYNIKRRLRFRLRSIVDALGAGKKYKYTSVINLLGCDIDSFKLHIESKFEAGMSWDNMSLWQIDHKVPCANFDLTIEDEQKKCFHWSNLQPLWEADNLSKGSKNYKEWQEQQKNVKQ